MQQKRREEERQQAIRRERLPVQGRRKGETAEHSRTGSNANEGKKTRRDPKTAYVNEIT